MTTGQAIATNLKELQQMLAARAGQENSVLFDLSCAYEFEPHGRASETWEIVWRLTIPSIPYHWQRNDGKWQRGTTDAAMEFKARAIETVVCAAVNFMREVQS